MKSGTDLIGSSIIFMIMVDVYAVLKSKTWPVAIYTENIIALSDCGKKYAKVIYRILIWNFFH
jgi:hypothetical protein